MINSQSFNYYSAQLMHGDFFHIKMITNGQEWIDHFRGQQLLHFASFLLAAGLIPYGIKLLKKMG
jgi:hypothetical protein